VDKGWARVSSRYLCRFGRRRRRSCGLLCLGIYPSPSPTYCPHVHSFAGLIMTHADAPLLRTILNKFPLSDHAHPYSHPPPPRARTDSHRPLLPECHTLFSEYRSSNTHFVSSEPRPSQQASGNPPVRTPVVLEPKQHNTPSPVKPPRTSLSPSRASPGHLAKSGNMDVPSSPSGLRPRPHQSPSRHHGLSALSPLQGLSPMPTASVPLPSPRSSHARSISGESDGRSAGGHSRAGSVTRSLSRRQSLYHSAAEWGDGKEYGNENTSTPASLFSRLTLVKAPASEQAGLRR
jgi:hypothetical protein